MLVLVSGVAMADWALVQRPKRGVNSWLYTCSLRLRKTKFSVCRWNSRADAHA